MDTRNGDMYPSMAAALAAGVPKKDLVEISGPDAAVRRVQKALRKKRASTVAKRRAKKRREQKASRRRNRA
jgi:hypothetical protein